MFLDDKGSNSHIINNQAPRSITGSRKNGRCRVSRSARTSRWVNNRLDGRRNAVRFGLGSLNQKNVSCSKRRVHSLSSSIVHEVHRRKLYHCSGSGPGTLRLHYPSRNLSLPLELWPDLYPNWRGRDPHRSFNRLWCPNTN